MSEAKNILKNNILEYFEEHGQLKFCWPFQTRWRRKDGTTFSHVFRARTRIFLHPQDFLELLEDDHIEIQKQFDEFLNNGYFFSFQKYLLIFFPLRSENILEAIESLNCEIYRYKPIAGGSFIPTPSKYAGKKAIVNIHNTKDNFCLLYSCIAKIR